MSHIGHLIDIAQPVSLVLIHPRTPTPPQTSALLESQLREMAEDVPQNANGHGGFRKGAGRKKGSKNRPKNPTPAAVPASAPSLPAVAAESATTGAKSVKRKPADKMLAGFQRIGRSIANFWATRPPQGAQAMTAEGLDDLAPDGPALAADAVARIQIEMPPPQERVFDEEIADGEKDEGGEDDEVDAGDEEDEAGLDGEQQRAEASSDSVNTQWLETTLDEIQKELELHGNGQLWIYPKDPIFALRDAATTKVFSPDSLYLLPIFLWLPNCLPGHPDRFYCECGEVLNKHVAISHRSALDISQMDMMKITFAGRFGTDPFSKMVRELKLLRHSRLQVMYLHAALHYGLCGHRQIPPFSLFKDRLHYAGYTPSTKYLKSMFIAWFASHQLHTDCIMSSLSARVLRADHTFKTMDHQGRLPGGEPIHTALYEGVNEYEEVRFYNLVLTQGFAPLQGTYERVQLELSRHGHTPTEVLYTGNPRHERNWHETVTPSLKRDVQHVVLDPFRELPEFKAPESPQFASSSDRIDTVCDNILQLLPPDDSIYMALAISLDQDRITAIQLRTKLAVYILDVTLFTAALPIALKSILTHPRIIKFGHSITTTAKRLSSTWRLDIPSPSLVDLGKLAKLKGAAADPNCSLATLCGAVLRLRLLEAAPAMLLLPVSHRLDILSRDVECAWLVQDALMKLGSVGIPLQPSQLRASQPVAFVIGNKTQAWGELVEHDGSLVVPGTEGSITVTNAYSVIKLTKLFVPGFIVAKHGQTLEWLNVHGGRAVVQTRTLRSRAPEPPHPGTVVVADTDLGLPAPVSVPSVADQLRQELQADPQQAAASIVIEPHTENVDSEITDEDDLMDTTPAEEPSADDLEELLLDAIKHAQDILRQPESAQTYASRVLDDAYHFMDRLLRLLSKKHPAYKEFAHLFSETIFVRDAEDEANVWNRRGFDGTTLFGPRRDLLDSDGKKFFSKDARKQETSLIESARLRPPM
uniref:3'-5' exonuclease domain-containing protein n=1 Tax=Mycena chlorophos TaxID=658473 RepID=A0ABQ0L2Q6_MYCCL|nr:predicted protein [Mycena chlorophos]